MVDGTLEQEALRQGAMCGGVLLVVNSMRRGVVDSLVTCLGERTGEQTSSWKWRAGELCRMPTCTLGQMMVA